MTPKQIELARQALGLPNDRRCSCRNRFIAGEGHADYVDWIAMVEAGHAQRHRAEKRIIRAEKRISRGDCVFQLTDEGAKAAVMPDEELNPYDFPSAYVEMKRARESQKDRFISPCPPPTAHQREVAEVLIEECAEVTQRATKLLRFGVDEVQPGQPLSNMQRLCMEIGDLQVMIEFAIAAGIADAREIEIGKEAKRHQLVRYLQTHAPYANQPTPVTPILIEAPSIQSLKDEGYEVRTVAAEPDDIGIEDDLDDGEAQIAAWEPDRPEGDGWILHCKYWTEEASILAIWARPDPATGD
jgi:hypothetical protein